MYFEGWTFQRTTCVRLFLPTFWSELVNSNGWKVVSKLAWCRSLKTSKDYTLESKTILKQSFGNFLNTWVVPQMVKHWCFAYVAHVDAVYKTSYITLKKKSTTSGALWGSRFLSFERVLLASLWCEPAPESIRVDHTLTG